jgi:ferric-dicitrate binding protein FerR (iron transport regulator)
MRRDEFSQILQRYLDGTASSSEREIVDKWFDSIDTHDHLSETELSDVQASAWMHLSGNQPPPRQWGWMRVAASILLAAATAVLFSWNDASEIIRHTSSFQSANAFVSFTNRDQVDYPVCLPDGSTVVLKPGSEIKYPLVFGSERTVMLRGIAFFDVQRDPQHPFLVQTKDVTTKVLGTSFWVQENAKSKTVEVSVKTGRVMVFAKETGESRANSLILKPNQKGVYDREEETLVKRIVDEPVVIDHSLKLQLKYENKPVSEIFDTLQRIYGIQINYDAQNLSNCSLTTELEEENLFERIQIICDALGLEYDINGESIEIKGHCK